MKALVYQLLVIAMPSPSNPQHIVFEGCAWDEV
jgi:hypothetical protein